MAISRIDILRDAVVKITQILADRSIKVTQSGINAFVQSDKNGVPVRVNLPYIPDNADEPLINAIQGFLDHEVAHILYSDFHLLETGRKAGVMNYLNTLEDPRIEIQMCKRFEGSAWNLSKVGEFFLERFTTPALMQAISEGDRKKAVMILMVPAVRAWSGQKLFQDYMSDKWELMEEVVDRLGADLIERIGKMGSSQDALDIAIDMKAALETDSEGEGGEGDTPEEKGSKGKSTKPTSSKKASDDTSSDSTGSTKDKEETTDEATKDDDDSKGDSKDKAPEDETSKEKDEKNDDDGEKGEDESPKDEESDDEEDDDDESSEPGGIGTDPSDTPDVEGTSSKAGSSRGKGGLFSSEEFEEAMKEADFESAVSGAIADDAADKMRDSEYLVYSKDEDIIEPLQITKSRWSDEFLTDLQKKVDHLVAPLQKDLERAIVARSYSQWSSGHRSGRLHGANLARLAANDPRVFRRKHESHSKDVAVSLVIDCSGSMNSGGRIFTAAEAAYAMSAVLDRLQISHEVIGFTSKGSYGDGSGPYAVSRKEVEEAEEKLGRSFSRYDRIWMPIVKGFNERLTIDTKKRFAFLPRIRLEQNVDGECIEIAVRRLMQRRENGKIMMVLSDGSPACFGDPDQQHKNLKAVVKRVEESGTKVIGIGIQTNSVKNYYSKSVVINNVSDLPGTVVKELKDLLIS